ncbi:hypothetical protein CHS0354_017914 [Potamilus streckersoni]|uniref:Thiaminase-2/PQQC domain-containing protein n=1 Tax=Potamilus streckersoni TaxID=2493646 RepID=A0AAE0W2M9_9BIVA|nr:hypothetical protein CHS0354_017914 [Potamilus streckersoni]
MSSRKSPRHAGLFAHKLLESPLFRDLADRASQLRLKADVEPLSEYLWQSTKSQQEDALKSKFIQGLQYGKLDPADFGGYMVQDSVYCYYSKESIDTAAEKATDPTLKFFLEKRSESYKKYYEELFTTWHIRDPTGIDLSKACADYAALEKNVAETMASLYLVVALIPCSKLWPWLGKQISDPPHNFGVYESWVNSNLDPNYDGYKKLDKIIDDAFLVGAIDKEKALCVYKACMTGEANFFSSV